MFDIEGYNYFVKASNSLDEALKVQGVTQMSMRIEHEKKNVELKMRKQISSCFEDFSERIDSLYRILMDSGEEREVE
jgi:hypothetical protein